MLSLQGESDPLGPLLKRPPATVHALYRIKSVLFSPTQQQVSLPPALPTQPTNQPTTHTVLLHMHHSPPATLL